MAKIGEGDPRWLVASREDGKNVNNWHWVETDCVPWSKKRLGQLLSDLKFLDDPEQGYCKTTTVQSVTGECISNVRKGKTIFYYEMEVKVGWEGKLKGANVTAKGQLIIPYLSEEQPDDKMEVKVTCEGSGPVESRLTDMVKTIGTPIVQQKIAEYLRDLREEFSVKKPSQHQKEQPASPQAEKVQEVKKAFKEGQGQPEKKPAPGSLSTKTIGIKEQFKAPPMDVYNMLTNPQMMNAITQGGSMINPTEGGTFALFNGAVAGENVKLVPGSKIVQKWRFNSWPEGHYSTVTMDFKTDSGYTILTLTQEGVPHDDAERTEQGWRGNIFGRGKMIFGYGSNMFM
jgi:activator of HSP90 ATPase